MESARIATRRYLLHPLNASPVLGVSMANVSMLRLDQLEEQAPGNKRFKLQGNLARARSAGADTLVSFGGAWSNHLHALAAVGREQDMRTVGVVRGERPARLSATLRDVEALGMELLFVSRRQYRLRDTAAFLDNLRTRYAPCLVIPEGGANLDGVRGCREIASLLAASAQPGSLVMLAVGTGTTLAGIAAGLPGRFSVEGVCVLKGVSDIEPRVRAWLSRLPAAPDVDWRLLHDYHCGGYARVNSELREFLPAFEQIQGMALDPVYTGKLMFAIWQRLRDGHILPGQPVVAVHTGGLQGRRGFHWLD